LVAMRKLLVFILSMVELAAPAAFCQTSMSVDAPSVVGMDEQFNVSFVVEGEKKPSSFSWEAGANFRVVWGPQQGSSHSVSFVNGQKIPAATATVGGKDYSSGTASIQVVSNGQSGGSRPSGSSGSSGGGSRSAAATGDISSDDLFMRLSLSSTHAVVGQPLTATLKLYQRVDISGFEDAKFPSFNGFWSKETAAPTNIQFRRESFDDKIYNTALIRSYVLIPQQSGDLKIDPAELVCQVAVRSARHTGSIFDDFFDSGYSIVRKRISTPAVTVHVSPLPSGAPASFSGGVGKFSIKASLDRDSLKANDAASLTITVSGRGNVSLLEAPTVKFHPDMEVYDAKTTDNSENGGTSGSKSFEYPFIPRSHGDFTIPPIEYSYYDTDAGKYVTLRTEAIAYHVEKGEGTASSIPVQGMPSVDRKGVRNLGEDIRFIETKAPSFASSPSFFVGNAAYWLLAALLALAAAAYHVVGRRSEMRKADVVGMRRRKATKMASGRLRKAKEFLDKKVYSAFYEELHAALLGYVSDKLNMGMEEMNHEDISERLSVGGVEKSVVDRFLALMDACEYARYSPAGESEAMSGHYDEAVEVISAMDSTMKKTGVAGKSVAVAIALMLSLQSVGSAAENQWADSLWNVGVEAYSAGRWQDAVDAWDKVLGAGIENAVLYYNAGNAHYKAEDYPQAILCYEKALKIDPSYSDARYNLEMAVSQTQDKIEAVPEFILATWYRKVSYLLGSNVWAVLSLVLLAAALALALVFAWGASSGRRKAGFFGGIAVILLAVLCFAFSRTQYADYQRADSAIVTAPVASVTSSPSEESAKDLFVLHGGTKVSILDNVGDWTEIKLADGREGWLPSSTISVI